MRVGFRLKYSVCLVFSGFWMLAGATCFSQVVQDFDRTKLVSHAFFVRQDCNTSNCHGRESITDEIWRSSGDIWLKRDPHASAYVGLSSSESLRIVQRLWPQGEAIPETTKSQGYVEFLESRCVACHASELAPRTQRVFGVDCQSCHGVAGVWGEAHYSPQWRGMGSKRFEDSSAHGRVNTGDVWKLAHVCVACHVGELERDSGYRFADGEEIRFGDREVTHSLMAAGHPPTYFEFSHAMQRYPRHWDTVGVSGEAEGNAEIELWRIGQLVAARQRVRLLLRRVQRGVEWELTEYRCSSCHHDVGGQVVERDPHGLGRVPWDGWYMEQVDLAILLSDVGADGSNNGVVKTGVIDVGDAGSLVQVWNVVLERLRSIMEEPKAMVTEDSRLRIAQECEVMLGILDPLIESRVGFRLPSDWGQVDRKLFESGRIRSWESGVQWQRAAGVIARRRGVQEAYKEEGLYEPAWGLPRGTWRRGERMNYSGSREYPRDITEWVEQIAETMKRKP